MPIFEYKAKDSKGNAISGTLEAESHQAAQASLRAKGIQPTLLRPASAAPRAAAPEPAARVTRSYEDDERPNRLPLLAFLVLLMLLGGGSYWFYQSRQPWGLPRLKAGDATRVLTVRGAIVFDVYPKQSDPWRQTQVRIFLPEIETEFHLDRNDLNFGPAGNFDVKLHYLAPAAPRIANVVVSQLGYQTARREGLKIPADTLEIPKITLEHGPASPSPTPAPSGGSSDEDE